MPHEKDAPREAKQEESLDHKAIGQELDLFLFNDLVGPGLPLWTPKGTVLRNELDNFVWELRKAAGYEKVEIPHMAKKDLYEKSGHWSKFKDDLFRVTTREGHEFAIKPMNCPHHTQIYSRKPQSYRDLPQRYANTTMCYRDEQTGELNGLARLRAFTQDDAHSFCRRGQVEEEFLKIWDIVDEFYSAFGFTLSPTLSLSDPDNMDAYLGDAEHWKQAEDALRSVAKKRGVKAPEVPGEAAFYGPKIDFMAKDSLGRDWQVATIQLDLNMPDRFDLTCVNEKGEDERIVMIHYAVMGAIERFLSILLEHTGGSLPAWLSPVQIAIATVSNEKHLDYAQKLADELRKKGARVWVDDSDESVGKKVRNSEHQKIPFTLVIGDKEIAGQKLAVRLRGERDTVEMDANELIEKLKR